METNKDSLQITVNEDGSVSFNWDKNDPKWNWLNNLSSEEIQEIVKKEMYGSQNTVTYVVAKELYVIQLK